MPFKAITQLLLPALLTVFSIQTFAYYDQIGHYGRYYYPIVSNYYDGETDDLLTAGLGKSELAGAAPEFVNPESPTDAELRRLAIYINYRALVPTDIGNGYGVFFGPNVSTDGVATNSEGLISGEEHLTYIRRSRQAPPVTLMVQIPDHFDVSRPCIITAPSSGSRGIYGAIGTAGEWGLKKGCAVAYTDKGTGTGMHNLANNSVNLINGQRRGAEQAGRRSHFTARLGSQQLDRFNDITPDRVAFKHAHSQVNPERFWGNDVLQSVVFAFYTLNKKFRQPQHHHGYRIPAIRPDNTIVIASSVSNGGGASLRAAEQDWFNLIDGVAVSEPNVNPRKRRFGIKQGDEEPFYRHSRSLFDYTTLINIFQSCANLAPGNLAAPFNFAPSDQACASLHDKGLLLADQLETQAIEAQKIINDYGVVPEQNLVQPSHWFVNVSQSISMTYANAYARTSVLRNLCGYSLGATDAVTGFPTMLLPSVEQAMFGSSNGIPPSAGINLINNLSPGGARENRVSISASTGRADQNLDGALCLRSLSTGRDAQTGQRLTGKMRIWSKRIKNSIRQLRASGNLHGKPALIVTGRSDAILPINHTSRPYFGLNQLVEQKRSRLKYIEITNAHHLDAFNVFPGFSENYVPLHHYLFEALNIMYAHLDNGSSLPPSQVVHTIPRGAGSPALTARNIPEIENDPGTEKLITFNQRILSIPE